MPDNDRPIVRPAPGRGTSDRGIEARGTDVRNVDDVGLTSFLEEPLDQEMVYDSESGTYLPCELRLFDILEQQIDRLEVRELERPKHPDTGLPTGPPLKVLLYNRSVLNLLLRFGTQITLVHDKAPCLIRLLELLDAALNLYVQRVYPKLFVRLAVLTAEAGNEIERRTRGPYKRNLSLQQHPALDEAILKLAPMTRLQLWRTYAGLATGETVATEQREPPDPEQAIRDLNAFLAHMDRLAFDLSDSAALRRIEQSAASSARTPLIDGSIRNLRELKYSHLQRNSYALFPDHLQDVAVWQNTQLIIYNSVYSVLLDRNGNPKRVPGVAPYALLLGSPGKSLIRRLQPPGLYISLAKIVTFNYRVRGLRAQSVIMSGLFGLQYDRASFRLTHDLQEKLQAYIGRSDKAIAIIVAPEAFKFRPLNRRTVYDAIQRMIPLMVVYAYEELQRKLRKFFDNPAETLKDLGKEVVLDIVTDEIRDWAIKWLVKKVGMKAIPVVGQVSTLWDLFDDEEVELVRNLLACLIMAARGNRRDDLAIASNVTGQIAVEQIGDKLVDKVVDLAKQKLGEAVKPDSSDVPTDTPTDTTPTDTTPTDTTPTDTTPTETTPTDTTPTDTTPTDMPRPDTSALDTPPPAQTAPDPPPPRQSAPPRTGERAGRPALDRQRATERPDTGGGDDGSGDGGRDGGDGDPPEGKGRPIRRRPSDMTAEERRRQSEQRQAADENLQRAEEGDDLEDTYRELTGRQMIDDRGLDPDIHDLQSTPQSVAEAKAANLPDELIDSGYVVTRYDYPENVSDRPVPLGKPAPKPLGTTGIEAARQNIREHEARKEAKKKQQKGGKDTPKPPAKKKTGPNSRQISMSKVQESEWRADIRLVDQQMKELDAKDARIDEVRLNQTQAIEGTRAGTNRPDVQLTIYSATVGSRRIYIEYDQAPPSRAIEHAKRIIANDPDAIVILKIVDFEKKDKKK